MAEIILDIGSGRSLHNPPRAEKMIDAIADMDSHKHTIRFKAQLFKEAPPNVPLCYGAFDHLYHYAEKLGYKMTASVFDKESLAFLLGFDIPFVKIACRPDLYWLIGEIPRKVKVYLSYDGTAEAGQPYAGVEYMFCVPKYPAEIHEYNQWAPHDVVSDHTVGWELFRKSQPRIIEKHLCPEREADNPDSGPFAVTPEELREVIA